MANAQEYKERLTREKITGRANEKQVGGEHYQQVDGEQHWDRQWRLNGRGYFIGCITKYVERYPLKNGIEDLEKARHFLDKLIELEKALKDQNAEISEDAAFVNSLSDPEMKEIVRRETRRINRDAEMRDKPQLPPLPPHPYQNIAQD